MIRVAVKNFQSLRDVEVVIRGLTVITGTNNAGKSALLRAIYSACINARGTHFVRKGAKYASVHLMFEDGEFVWEKGAKDNRYIVNGLTIDKVSHGAPKEVADFKVRAIQAGNQSLWPQIAHQNEGGVFLFNQSGAVMAEAVADVDRVGLLTKALRISESEARSAQEQIKIRRSDLSSVLARRKLLDALPAMEEAFRALQGRQSDVQRQKESLQEMKALRHRRDTLTALVACLEGVDRIALPERERLDAIKKTATKAKALSQIQAQWSSLSSYVTRWSSLTEGVERLQRLRFEESLQSIKGREATVSALMRIRQEMVSLERRVSEDDRAVKRLQAEIEEIRQKMAVCPTCQRPLGRAS